MGLVQIASGAESNDIEDDDDEDDEDDGSSSSGSSSSSSSDDSDDDEPLHKKTKQVMYKTSYSMR